LPSPGLLAQAACLMEVTARKPGNVHRGCDFDDSHYFDFLLSAAALAGPLDRAREIGVGRAVREAIEASRQLVATNTNLGMVLLLAPLAAVPEDQAVAGGSLTSWPPPRSTMPATSTTRDPPGTPRRPAPARPP
jgi:triphosphoribosyl-dephospho-CoA synthase